MASSHGLGGRSSSGADLVWLMDDDGLRRARLPGLLLERADLDFWGRPCVAAQDPDRLCFPIRLPGGTTVVHELADGRAAAEDGLIRGVVIPFNGVLVTRELVERIGLPRAEFFIWGDDVEYLWRAEAAGASVATVVEALVLHPATDDLGTPMMFGRTTYNHSPSDLKHYCMVRNNAINLAEYRGWPHVLMFWAKTCGSTFHPAATQPAPAERAGGSPRAARRLHRPPEVPPMTDQPRTRPSPSSW